MDLRYFNDMTNQNVRQPIDLSPMSDQELYALQQRIYAETQQRQAAARANNEKVGKDFLASSEAQQLKADIQALEAEFSLLPKKIDLNQKITLKLSAEMSMYESVTEIIENGDDPCGFTLELEDASSVPEDLKSSIESMIDDLNSDYNPAGEFLQNSFDGRQWSDFLQKLKGLDDRLKGLYDAGLDLDDLMEE